MRLGEECPYITPCGFCSRQGKPCEKKPRYRIDLPAVDITPATEAFNKLASALNLPEVEEADTLSSTKGYCAASKSIKKY